MRTRLIPIAAFLAILAASLVGRVLLNRSDETAPPGDEVPERIVSMSPNITEILFALGLGDRVVGVTRYCRYPPEAQDKTLVGGYLNPNFEAILALKPDLVILPGGNESYVLKFRELNLKTLPVRHNGIEEILDSIATIGDRCGAGDKARDLIAGIQSRMERIARKTEGLDRPRVLIVAERDLGTGRLQNLCIAGADGFMNRLIALAGGRNACSETRVVYPRVSAEGILTMNPQVILDLVARERQAGLSREAIVRDWRQLSGVEAVRSGRVHLVDEDYVFIPGPRLVLTIEKLARLIHPELPWEP